MFGIVFFAAFMLSDVNGIVWETQMVGRYATLEACEADRAKFSAANAQEEAVVTGFPTL